MSMAWEVTVEDIERVLEAHNSEKDADDVYDTFTQNLRVEKAVLWYQKFDDQMDASLDEIEDILIEEKVIEGPKFFRAPKTR